MIKNKSEDEIQHECYVWFNNTYCLTSSRNPNKNRCLLFSVPNGGSRNVLEAIRLKNTGVLSGVSDLVMVLPQKVVFVEMKASGGRLSDSQKDFAKRVNDLGFVFEVCYSLEEFQEMTKRHIDFVK